MSRIGKLPITLPQGVSVNIADDNTVTLKGPKGELTQQVNPDLNIKVEDGVLTVERPNDDKEYRAQHGLYRALLHNMVVGVSEGFRKDLELVGVGYRASNQGQILELSLGYTHSIFMELPKEIKVETKSERNPNHTKEKEYVLLANRYVANPVKLQVNNLT